MTEYWYSSFILQLILPSHYRTWSFFPFGDTPRSKISPPAEIRKNWKIQGMWIFGFFEESACLRFSLLWSLLHTSHTSFSLPYSRPVPATSIIWHESWGENSFPAQTYLLLLKPFAEYHTLNCPHWPVVCLDGKLRIWSPEKTKLGRDSRDAGMDS